jgi:hypothetical protein
VPPPGLSGDNAEGDDGSNPVAVDDDDDPKVVEVPPENKPLERL